MEIVPLGDSAVLVRVAENFDDAPENALHKVLAAKHGLEAARIPGVVEVTPAYTTVALFYDPIGAVDAGAPSKNVFELIEQQIRKALSDDDDLATDRVERTIVEVPVCYEAEFAPDLEEVAQRAGIHWKEVVDLHCSAEYRVHCVGFTPGFPFLGGLSRK